MAQLSPSDEQKLLDAVQQTTSLIDQGLSPNQAMQKVATQLQLQPGFLRIAVNAANTGLELASWNEKSAAEDRLTSFPLIDYDTVLAAVYQPTETKQAEALPADARWYQNYQKARQQTWQSEQKQAALEKVAFVAAAAPAAPEVPEAVQHHRLLAEFRQKKAATLSALRKLASAQEQLDLQQRQTVDSFFNSDTVSDFSQFQREIQACGTPAEKQATAWIARQLPERYSQQPKTASVSRSGYLQQRGRLRPMLAAVQTTAEKLAEAQEALANLEQLAGPQGGTSAKPGLADELFAQSKTAGFSDLIPKVKPIEELANDDEVRRALDRLDTLPHNRQLQMIRARTMMGRMMSDPSSPISSYAPAKVLSAYNDMAPMLPRGTMYPASLESLLARRLAGPMEVHELDQLLKAEKTMTDAGIGAR